MLNTTAHWRCCTYSLMLPRLRRAKPRGLVSDARLSTGSKQLKKPFRIGMARAPRPPSWPTGSTAQAQAVSGGRTAADGAGQGLSLTPPSPPSPARKRGEGRVAGGSQSGRRPACSHAGAHRSHRTMTRQDLLGRDRVYPERLQQLRAKGGHLSPQHHHSSQPWTSGNCRRPSYLQSRRSGLDAVDVVTGHAP